jgi:hypothetical protein
VTVEAAQHRQPVDVAEEVVGNTSTAKWATDPAFEVGTSAASPRAKMLSNWVDRNVCLSTGT